MADDAVLYLLILGLLCFAVAAIAYTVDRRRRRR